MALLFSPVHTAAVAATVLAALSTSACGRAPALPDRNAPIEARQEATLPFTVDVVSDGLRNPWAVAFFENGSALITERGGALWHWNAATGDRTPVQGVPEVEAQRQGGLLDVALDPDFADTGFVYLSWSAPGDAGSGTAVGRGRLEGNNRLRDFTTLFSLPRKTGKGVHFGSRFAFDDEGDLYFSIGDRGDRDRSQALDDPAGSILRIHRDGRIPDDNPFRSNPQAHPALFSMGHRNPQGLAWDATRGELIAHEHGPQGGDEVNTVHAGRNYGWPRVTYGVEYVSGLSIGEGQSGPGFEDPQHVWIPSIAPSGLAIYAGESFADWQGDLLVGALRAQLLVRLERNEGQIVAEHRYDLSEYGRIRDVRVGPDGDIYLLTDSNEGRLLRLRPRENLARARS